MATPHMIGGVVAAPTLTGREVLAQAELLSAQCEHFYRAYPTYPSPWTLIREASTGRLDRPGYRYAYEPQRDDYLLPGQGIIVPLKAWEKYREQTLNRWDEVIAEFGDQWIGPFVVLIDCEDASAQGSAYSRAHCRRAWVVILEWLHPWGTPRNWHAIMRLELPDGAPEIAGQIGPPDTTAYTNAPSEPEHGHYFVDVDLAWLGGMPRSARAAAAGAAGAGWDLRELARIVCAVGPWDPVVALAIALAEMPSQVKPGRYLGPWQIDWKLHGIRPEQANDLYFSTAFAHHRLFRAKGFQPWGAFLDGRYKAFLKQANQLIGG